MMGQPVQQGRGHAFALEDLAPLAERQVAREQQAGPLIAIREDLEQQLRPGPAERQVAQLIADQQVQSVELAQEAIELVLLLGLLQAGHQVRRREEPHPPAGPAGRQTQGDRQVRFANPRVSDQAQVLVLVQPLAAGQLHDLLLVQVRHATEVVAVQVLIDRERRLLDPRLQRVGRPLRRLQFHQTQQVLQVMGVLLSRLLRQLLVLGQHRRQSQPLQMHRQ